MKQYIRKTIKFYDESVEDYIKNTKSLQEKEWLKKFVSYIPKKAKILDLGCAYGRDCRFFADKGFGTYGVDLSKNMIEKAKSSVRNASFQVMDMLDLKFKSGFFGGVWCSATLIHIKKKDVPEALAGINRVLKKGGVLYLNLKEGSGEKTIKDERYMGTEKFYSYFTEDEIKGILGKNGFRILDFRVVFYKDEYRKDAGRIYLIARKVSP